MSVVLAMLFILSSCNKKNDIGKRIPSDALTVVHFNTKSLLDKLPWSDIKSSDWFQEAYKKSSQTGWSKQLLDDPAASGFDSDKGLTLFIGKGEGGGMNIVVEGNLKDAESFSKFNQHFDSSASITKDGDLSILGFQGKALVGWNKSQFIYVMPIPESANKFQFGEDSKLPSDTDNFAAATAYCKKLFNLPEKSSLAGDSRFSDLMKENGDIQAWVNNESMMKLSPAGGAMGMFKLGDLYENSRTAYTVDFDNGAIVMSGKGYLGKKLLDLVKKYKGSGINTSLISNIPSDDIEGLYIANFKPKLLTEILKLIGVDGLANLTLTKFGLTIDDIANAMDGDLLFSVSDLQKDTTASPVPDMHALFVMGIGDKASFQKVLDAIHKVVPPEMTNSGKVVMKNNDKEFVISNNDKFAQEFMDGKQNNKPEFMDKLSGNSIGFYLDMQKILSFIPVNNMDSLNVQAINKSKAFWGNVVASGGSIKDNAITGKATLNLQDKSTNSLKELNTYMNEMFLIMKTKNENKELNTVRLDSLLTPPPIDTLKVP